MQVFEAESRADAKNQTDSATALHSRFTIFAWLFSFDVFASILWFDLFAPIFCLKFIDVPDLFSLRLRTKE